MTGRRFAASIVSLMFLFGCASGGAPKIVRSHWDRPPTNSAEVRTALSAALERRDRRSLTKGLLNLVEMGFSLSPASQARLAPLIDESVLPPGWRPPGPIAENFATWFRNNERSFNYTEPYAEVPAEHRLIEGIAWDSAKRRLFVGSVIDRRLLVRDGEAWRIVPTDASLGGVFGMAIDAKARLLWLASSAADPMPDPETAYSGLVAIDLDGLRESRRIEIPGARLGDVAVANDGTVFASDGRSGAIYRCRPGCAAAETFIPPGLLRSPQGMAVWPGRGLYVADYAMGLMRIDLSSRRVEPVFALRPVMLDGIDGLVRKGDRLFAIQNGTRPARIIAMRFDTGGRRLSDLRVLDKNGENWGEPTLGTIIDDNLAFIVDGQWERFGPGGRLTDGGAPRPTAIRLVYAGEDVTITRSDKMPPAEALLSLATPRPGS